MPEAIKDLLTCNISFNTQHWLVNTTQLFMCTIAIIIIYNVLCVSDVIILLGLKKIINNYLLQNNYYYNYLEHV